MTTMIAEVYDALLAAGSPEDKARRAAEAVAGYENRFTAIDQRLAKIESDFGQRFGKIEGDLRLLTWMVGFNLAAMVGVFFLLLRH
ncbi:MAG: integrase [Alphaproteobacteria bacterium]|nr:integrase [Alphaproteobacteria bacterium]